MGPRYAALHDHDRDTFAKLRRHQSRTAIAAARIGAAVQREVLSEDPELRRRFVRLLPPMAWASGRSAPTP